jgi:hypothetical protein
MRGLVCGILLSLLGVGTVDAQLLWAGGAAGSTWEWRPAAAPGSDFLHGADVSPSLFLGLVLENDTILRFQALELDHDTVLDGEVWPGSFRGATIGVDYHLPGVIGKAIFSGGFGAFELNLDAASPPAGAESTKFGYYVGIGEWIQIARRVNLTLEFTWTQTNHRNSPGMLRAAAGLAVALW